MTHSLLGLSTTGNVDRSPLFEGVAPGLDTVPQQGVQPTVNMDSYTPSSPETTTDDGSYKPNHGAPPPLEPAEIQGKYYALMRDMMDQQTGGLLALAQELSDKLQGPPPGLG